MVTYSPEFERSMARRHVENALFIRRSALHQLRMGDRLGHRMTMAETKLPLKQARAWKVKK